MQGFSREPGTRRPAEKGVAAAAKHAVGRRGAAVGGVVDQAPPPVADVVGQRQSRWIFADVRAFGLVRVGRFFPETLGPGLEEVDASIRSRFGHKPPSGRSGDGGGHGTGTRD